MKIFHLAAIATLSLAAVPGSALAQPRAATSAEVAHSATMRGSIVGASRGKQVICIGSADGAKAGQVLSVYRVVFHPHGPRGGGDYRRTKTGSIRIDAVIDEHFARVTLVSGAARTNDIVELDS